MIVDFFLTRTEGIRAMKLSIRSNVNQIKRNFFVSPSETAIGIGSDRTNKKNARAYS